MEKSYSSIRYRAKKEFGAWNHFLRDLEPYVKFTSDQAAYCFIHFVSVAEKDQLYQCLANDFPYKESLHKSEFVFHYMNNILYLTVFTKPSPYFQKGMPKQTSSQNSIILNEKIMRILGLNQITKDMISNPFGLPKDEKKPCTMEDIREHVNGVIEKDNASFKAAINEMEARILSAVRPIEEEHAIKKFLETRSEATRNIWATAFGVVPDETVKIEPEIEMNQDGPKGMSKEEFLDAIKSRFIFRSREAKYAFTWLLSDGAKGNILHTLLIRFNSPEQLKGLEIHVAYSGFQEDSLLTIELRGTTIFKRQFPCVGQSFDNYSNVSINKLSGNITISDREISRPFLTLRELVERKIQDDKRSDWEKAWKIFPDERDKDIREAMDFVSILSVNEYLKHINCKCSGCKTIKEQAEELREAVTATTSNPSKPLTFTMSLDPFILEQFNKAAKEIDDMITSQLAKLDEISKNIDLVARTEDEPKEPGFKPGDLVDFKSGHGPRMVVSSINPEGFLICSWFSDQHFEFKSDGFEPTSLVKVVS